MTEQELVEEAKALGRWEQHRFMLLVGIAIVAALFLVSVALMLYNSSGAAQLDLSRPGYQSVRQQASQTETFTSFPSTGDINKKSLSEFRALYDKQVKNVTAVDSFGGNVMDEDILAIDEPAQE